MGKSTLRLLITGASGSGTSTLGRALASSHDWRFLDADDYYWLQTTPPYGQRRDKALRLQMINADLSDHKAVVAGSLMNWGRELEDSFDLIVFLYLDADLRVERLRQRETKRFGRVDPAFLKWAAAYDSGPSEGRSLARHQQWLAERSCEVLRLEGDFTVDERCQRVQEVLQAMGKLN